MRHEFISLSIQKSFQIILFLPFDEFGNSLDPKKGLESNPVKTTMVIKQHMTLIPILNSLDLDVLIFSVLSFLCKFSNSICDPASPSTVFLQFVNILFPKRNAGVVQGQVSI